MPNLRDIRKRIESSINITKITTTMERIASVHVTRMMRRVESSKAYHGLLLNYAEDIFHSACYEHAPYDLKEMHLLTPAEKIKAVGVVFITSNQGLCAGFNIALNHEIERFEKKIQEDNLTLRYYAVGKKAVNYLDHRGLASEYTLVGLKDDFIYEEIKNIGNRLRQDLERGHIDDLYIIYTHYEAAGTYRVVTEPLLPWNSFFQRNEKQRSEKQRNEKQELPKGRLLICHPTIPELLHALVPELILNRLYKALLESMLCEQIVRRIAMKQATDAAEDMIDELRGLYHNLRKARITQEVNEMMGTVLALQRD